MSSTRGLVEEQRFRRRRLLGALLSGDARSPDEAVPRPGSLVWGSVLSVLLLAGAAAWGALGKAPASGWDDARLVVGRTSGARFVSLGGTLHPVTDTTSARLVLPAGSGFRVEVVDDALIAAAPHGLSVGIPGAPDELAGPGTLIPSGWVACLDGGRVLTTISSRPPPPAATDLALTVRVRARADAELLVSGRRFPLPVSGADRTTRLLGLSAPAVEAPAAWLDLFTPGPALDEHAFRFPATAPVGTALPSAGTVGGRVRTVGQLVHDVDHAGAVSVVLADGTLPLSAFAVAVYRATVTAVDTRPVEVGEDDLAGTPLSAATGFVPDAWPRRVPGAASGSPCATLESHPGRAPVTHLALPLPDSEWVHPPGGTDTGVEPGHGALVRSEPVAGGGPVVVDPTGTAFTVVDPVDDTLTRLGYGGVDPAVVPVSWLHLLRRGPDLSTRFVTPPGSPPATSPGDTALAAVSRGS